MGMSVALTLRMTGPPVSSLAATLKECPCCGARYGSASWRRLALCGEMSLGRTRIELRQCACESTIALRVSGDGVLVGEGGAASGDRRALLRDGGESDGDASDEAKRRDS